MLLEQDLSLFLENKLTHKTQSFVYIGIYSLDSVYTHQTAVLTAFTCRVSKRCPKVIGQRSCMRSK